MRLGPRALRAASVHQRESETRRHGRREGRRRESGRARAGGNGGPVRASMQRGEKNGKSAPELRYDLAECVVDLSSPARHSRALRPPEQRRSAALSRRQSAGSSRRRPQGRIANNDAHGRRIAGWREVLQRATTTEHTLSCAPSPSRPPRARGRALRVPPSFLPHAERTPPRLQRRVPGRGGEQGRGGAARAGRSSGREQARRPDWTPSFFAEVGGAQARRSPLHSEAAASPGHAARRSGARGRQRAVGGAPAPGRGGREGAGGRTRCDAFPTLSSCSSRFFPLSLSPLSSLSLPRSPPGST